MTHQKSVEGETSSTIYREGASLEARYGRLIQTEEVGKLGLGYTELLAG